MCALTVVRVPSCVGHVRSASFLASSVSRQVQCGRYCPGGAGMKSRMRRPKMIWCVSVGYHSSLECVSVLGPTWSGAANQHPLDCFHAEFRRAVTVRVSYAANAVVYTLVAEECLSGSCHKFRSPVRREFPGHAEGNEHSAECSNKSFGALCVIFYHWPIRVSIHGDEVIVTAVAEVVSSYCMEGVYWSNWRHRWCIWMGRRHAIARCTPCTCFFDCRCHSRPEE